MTSTKTVSRVLLVGAAFALSVATSICAQQPQADCAKGVSIEGVVRGSGGAPIEGAVVGVAGGSAAATTNASGAFALSGVIGETYRLTVTKEGVRRIISEARHKGDGCVEKLDLILALGTGSSSGSATAKAPDAMEFADEPNFSIAGVTDWTAVGGHGSDSTLRMSESLANESASLTPEGVDGASAQGGAGADSSGAHRGDLAAGQGVEAVHKLLKQEPSARLYREAAEVDESTGNPLAAVHEFQEAAKLEPSEENYFAWGSELLKHRAVWQAIEVFRAGVKLYPRSTRLQTAMATALFAGARYEEAAMMLCNVADAVPGGAAAYVFMGKIQIAAPNELACVGPRLERYARQHPGDAEANYLYAMDLLKRQLPAGTPQNLEEAKALLMKAIAANPQYGEAYLQMGVIAATRGDYPTAIKSYTEAIKIDPEIAEAYYRLGVAYDRTSQPAKAKVAFDLHDRITQQQKTATERERLKIKQFVFAGSSDPETLPLP